MRAVSMENSGRWPVGNGERPTPLPSHATVIIESAIAAGPGSCGAVSSRPSVRIS